MVPLAAVLLVLDAGSLAKFPVQAPFSVSGALRLTSAALVCVFYVLILWCYLRRGPAVASTRSATASVVAVLATFASLFFPLLAGPVPGTPAQVATDLLLVAGTAWSVWSLRSLGRNLSLIAQAREVADRGPYRLVRHPLYAGEIVSALGMALTASTFAAFALWVALVAMQVYRALAEERVLLGALPGYRDYRARTAALVPGLF